MVLTCFAACVSEYVVFLLLHFWSSNCALRSSGSGCVGSCWPFVSAGFGFRLLVLVTMAASVERSVSQTFNDLKGLCEKWDSDLSGSRVREFGRLLLEEPAKGQAPVVPEAAVGRTVANFRFNSFVVSPLLVKMRGKTGHVPDIGALMGELTRFFHFSKFMAGTLRLLTSRATPGA